MNCLICLDNCENNFLQFPNNLTKCTCRYCVHDECIDYYKDFDNIIRFKCLICRDKIIKYDKNIYGLHYYLTHCLGIFLSLFWAIILLGIFISPIFTIIFMNVF